MLLLGVHSTDQSSQCVEQTRALNPLHQLEGSHHHQHQADEVHEDKKGHCAEPINDWRHPLWKRKALSPSVVATFCQNPCCSSQPWLLTFVSAPPSSQQQLFFKSWYREWNPFWAIYLSLCSPVRWRLGMSLIFFSDNARLTRECRACPCPSTSLNQWKGYPSLIHWSAILKNLWFKVTEYPLLVEKLAKSTPPEHPDYTCLMEALQRARTLCEQVIFVL